MAMLVITWGGPTPTHVSPLSLLLKTPDPVPRYSVEELTGSMAKATAAGCAGCVGTPGRTAADEVHVRPPSVLLWTIERAAVDDEYLSQS
jgi:hypothetical protein